MKKLKVFVVNLKRSPERFKLIKQQLDKQNIEFERFEAIDGATLENFTDNFNVKKFAMESMHELVPGEAGCSWSHINIWKKMQNENIEYALILEDDVVLMDKLNEFLSNKDNYEDFDYLKLDNTLENIAEALHCNTNEINQNAINVLQKNEYHLFEIDPVPYATGGYIISQKGASIFLNSSKNMYYPIDLLPRYTFPYTKQGTISPPLIAHRDNESNIETRTFDSFKKKSTFTIFWNKINNKRRLRQISVRYFTILNIFLRGKNV
jgi:glycosyl transferase family 25